MRDAAAVTTFLFADIEGSTRLWERFPEQMRPALARHDELARSAVERNRGTVVKTIGDGVHAAFDDPLDALKAALQLQQGLAAIEADHGVAIRVRCGLHAGADERRNNDYFGNAVNRAARITHAAHGGQILVSHAVATLITGRLPPEVELRELGTVRLRDLSTPERIYQVVHPSLRSAFPPLRALESTPHNLPHALTSFIGRERELDEIRELLVDARLVTLHGVGGLGKTRLSLQVAESVLEAFPDGVWFVELAALTDATRVAQSVASAIGVKEEAGRPVIEALAKYVSDRALLIVLDNCEHLIQACAEVAAQLLRAGPRVRILASSRELLRVSGETTYPVPALSLPDASTTIDVATLGGFEAVWLFVARAKAVQPAFALDQRNAAAVADICRRVDGIALAIELAAACVRTLSVQKIASRLEDRFALLRGGDRTSLPRQQTLRALIDWSYDLLDPTEQTAFRRLSVFAGGFTIEAAEALLGDATLDPGRVLELVTSLVEKSLVAMDDVRERYRMLETVRQYAQERLDQSRERDEVRTRHLDFYVRYAETARSDLTGPDQARWLARLDDERENLFSAHAWAGHADNGTELDLRLVNAAKLYWINRGLLASGYRVAVEAVARTPAGDRSIARCRGLFDTGQLAIFTGRYDAALPYLQEALAVGRSLGNKNVVAAVLQPLGVAALAQSDVEAARGYLEEAVALAEELGNPRELAAALNGLAQLHRMQREPDIAEPLYDRVLQLARELGDRESVAIALLNLAMVSIGRGATGRARALLLEVHAIASESGSKAAAQSLLEVCAGFAASLRQGPVAARLYGAAEAQMRASGLRRDPADEAFLAPLVAAARSDAGDGFERAEAEGRTLSLVDALAGARDWLDAAQPLAPSRPQNP
ncbi:MAG TPA: tetratricopeptide repeat protein [Casimicrobiaceae bacterium]|nr:tetratricopeptide repeat protein [Casimicrobiaceae bacterium]